jgi:hypothetical protein
MYSQSSPTSAPNNDYHNQTLLEARRPIIAGRLNKGLNRLVKVLERRVDRQIMAAQIRAYDNSSKKHGELRYEKTATI